MALLICLVFPLLSQAQCLLYKVSLEERNQHSELIVEGKILEKSCFRHNDRLIYTASKIQVQTVYKGELPGKALYLITPGGRIGDQMIKVDPAIEPIVGESGIFFLKNSPKQNTELPSQLQFDAFASVQGFLQFDPLGPGASDPLTVYPDREKLRQEIALLSGQSPLILEENCDSHPLVQGSQKTVMPPGITSFSPSTANAGVSAVLTISGSGFESFDGGTNSTVFFANANDGGATFTATPASEILSWTNTQITLNVPSGAGTGSFIVRSASGLTGNSPGTLTVPFNHTNVTSSSTRFPVHLTNDNGSGGYTLVLSTNTANSGVNFASSAALAPFTRALDTWVCSTGFNVVVSGTSSSTTVDPNDATNLVMFDNAAAPLPAGVLGRATSGYGSCTGTSWFVNGFDVQFRRDGTGGVTWNFGPAATAICCFDFESVAVHELGHAHQLGHIIAPGRVMHFAIANGSDSRVLNATSDIGGGNFVMSQSNGYSTCFGSVTGISPAVCTPLAIQFESFAGTHIGGNQAQLNWAVDLQEAVANFVIERSESGEFWTVAGKVDANQNRDNHHSFLDPGFQAPQQLYRVTAHLMDGSEVQSDWIQIQAQNDAWEVKVYPNPFHDQFSIESRQNSEEVSIEFFAADGKKVFQTKMSAGIIHPAEGIIHRLPEGIYFLKLRSGGKQQIFRLVKN